MTIPKRHRALSYGALQAPERRHQASRTWEVTVGAPGLFWKPTVITVEPDGDSYIWRAKGLLGEDLMGRMLTGGGTIELSGWALLAFSSAAISSFMSRTETKGPNR